MSLEDVKNYLRIDDHYDDLYLQSLIEISEIYIDSCVGERYKNNNRLVRLATLAQYKLINDMYENRSSYVNEKSGQDRIVTTILDKLSNVEVI